MSCFVPGCTNIKRMKPAGITFHRFPQDPQRYKQWLKIIGKSDQLEWRKNRCICSKHFKSTDLTRSADRTFLRLNTVPSLFLAKPLQINKSIEHNRAHEEYITTQDLCFESFADDMKSRLHCPVRIKCENEDNTRESLVNFINFIHSYSTSPEILKSKYCALKKSQVRTRKRLYCAKRTIINLKKKITVLKCVVENLKKCNRS